MTVSRRLLAQGMIAAVLSPSPAWPQPSYADPVAAERWLGTWMNALGAVSEALYLGRFAEPIYFLREKISWTPNAGQESLPPVTVPVGFVTDFASIPRIFWSALPPDGTYTYAAIIHDYLYWIQPPNVTREQADQIFKRVMEDFDIDTVTTTAIYSAVRAGGWAAWDDNRARRAAGERRILTRFPTAPTTSWVQWKAQPGVFWENG